MSFEKLILQDTLTRILEKLAISGPLEADFTGLARIYSQWCRLVPFDNIRKTTALCSNTPGPLPGTDAEDFLRPGWNTAPAAPAGPRQMRSTVCWRAWDSPYGG